MIGAVKNYNVTLVLPNGASHERKCIMPAYGATIEEVDGGLDAACNRADELEKQGAVQLRQFSNTANPQSHYEITGPDIVEQVGDRTIDAFVAGTGTGGTISGMGPSFLPDTFDQDLLDGVETVELAAAHSECRRLAERGGILVGPSSGASAIGAKRVATALEEDGVDNPLVITTFWDSGERYLSTGIFEPDYDC